MSELFAELVTGKLGFIGLPFDIGATWYSPLPLNLKMM